MTVTVAPSWLDTKTWPVRAFASAPVGNRPTPREPRSRKAVPSTTDTVLSCWFEVYTWFVRGTTVTPVGNWPTPSVETSMLVDPSMAKMRLPARPGTQMKLVCSLTATAVGSCPRPVTVAITVLVEPSITDTVFALKSATYARFVRALTPIPLGPSPTSTVAITWGRAAGADAAAGADTAIAMQIASGRIANRRGLIADRLCRVIDLELLDDYVLSRPVLGTRRSGRDGLDHVHPFDHLAEDRVLAVQPRRGGDGDEELRPVRVRPGVGHGQEAGAVERRSVRRALVLELIPEAAAARSLGVPALDHEIGDDAVKDRGRGPRGIGP